MSYKQSQGKKSNVTRSQQVLKSVTSICKLLALKPLEMKIESKQLRKTRRKKGAICLNTSILRSPIRIESKTFRFLHSGVLLSLLCISLLNLSIQVLVIG